MTCKTVKRWKSREGGEDAPSRPHRIKTSFEDRQEVLIVEIRRDLLLPPDDLLVIVRKFILPSCVRSSLNRLLVRHKVNDLRALSPAEEEKGVSWQPKSGFKQYNPGYIHIDVKYLPKMPDEERHRYLFVAIDRATRWVHLEIYEEKTALNAEAFLEQVTQAFPGKIEKVPTDNGKEFTDRFCRTGERELSGKRPFDQRCRSHHMEHRLIKPRHPQANSMVERFNERIAE